MYTITHRQEYIMLTILPIKSAVPTIKKAPTKTFERPQGYIQTQSYDITPVPYTAFVRINQPTFKARIEKDIEFDEYKAMPEEEIEKHRKLYDDFYKLVDIDQLYITRNRNVNSKLPLTHEKDMDDFIKVSKAYNKYKDNKIICVGRSPKWFLNTSIWMKDGIEDYDFAAFSSNWYSRRGLSDKQFLKKDKLPTQEERIAYRNYLERVNCTPQNIVDAAKKTGKPVIITDYIHSGCGLASFLDILAQFAKEDGILEEFANSIKLFTLSSIEYFDYLEIDNTYSYYPALILPDILKPFKIEQEYHDMPMEVMKGVLIDKNTNECRSTYYPPIAWPIYDPDKYRTNLIPDDELRKLKKVGSRMKIRFTDSMRDYRNLMNFRILDALNTRKLLKATHITR